VTCSVWWAECDWREGSPLRFDPAEAGLTALTEHSVEPYAGSHAMVGKHDDGYQKRAARRCGQLSNLASIALTNVCETRQSFVSVTHAPWSWTWTTQRHTHGRLSDVVAPPAHYGRLTPSARTDASGADRGITAPSVRYVTTVGQRALPRATLC
jgi:hypothetical protein